jgi:hypothetical protein
LGIVLVGIEPPQVTESDPEPQVRAAILEGDPEPQVRAAAILEGDRLSIEPLGIVLVGRSPPRSRAAGHRRDPRRRSRAGGRPRSSKAIPSRWAWPQVRPGDRPRC